MFGTTVNMTAQKLRIAENTLIEAMLSSGTMGAKREALKQALSMYGDALLLHHKSCEQAAAKIGQELLPVSR